MGNSFRVSIKKNVVNQISLLPRKEKDLLLGFLNFLEKNRDPFAFGYETLSRKIGDIVFYTNSFSVLAKVRSKIITLIGVYQ